MFQGQHSLETHCCQVLAQSVIGNVTINISKEEHSLLTGYYYVQSEFSVQSMTKKFFHRQPFQNYRPVRSVCSTCMMIMLFKNVQISVPVGCFIFIYSQNSNLCNSDSDYFNFKKVQKLNFLKMVKFCRQPQFRK